MPHNSWRYHPAKLGSQSDNLGVRKGTNVSVAIVTGAAGLIGSEAVRHFSSLGMQVVGIDNNMRAYFFGEDASTMWMRERLEELRGYEHYSTDIRNADEILKIFKHFGRNVKLVVHTAAQPSHDWAAREPFTDFSVNAVGTLTLLEAARQFSSDAVFIFTSTNKVYGDAPNRLPLVEKETRWEMDPGHQFSRGISEDMSIDRSMHSIFGASKVAADLMVQEYGRYFGMSTACFRGGCLTGPNHSGAQLHGFLAYLMKCCVTGTPYQVFGYKGKQVRDNIHSADLISAFEQVFRAPRKAEVYNMGGGRFSNCSMLEAIGICEEISGRKLKWKYSEDSRQGDHIWWISDIGRFQAHYPDWKLTYDVPLILREIYEAMEERWLAKGVGA
jgi:CDP-paratose 2-epimerase